MEPDQEIRDLLRDCFDLVGYNLIGVSHCDLALLYLNLVDGALPDLVILDLQISDPTCRRMLDRIRRDPEVADVPVVFLPACPRGSGSGTSDLLRPALPVQALIELVRRYLGGGATFAPPPA